MSRKSTRTASAQQTNSLITDASFTAAGYAALIEDDLLVKYTSTRKVFAPVAYGSKTFCPAQTKMSTYAKDFVANFFAFKEFGHILWGPQDWRFYKQTIKFQHKHLSSYTLECVWLRNLIKFYNCTHTWQKQHRRGLPVSPGNLSGNFFSEFVKIFKRSPLNTKTN